MRGLGSSNPLRSASQSGFARLSGDPPEIPAFTQLFSRTPANYGPCTDAEPCQCNVVNSLQRGVIQDTLKPRGGISTDKWG
jgi:hypothetical protein